MKKRSIFERLSGTTPGADDYEAFEDEYVAPQSAPRRMPIAQSVPTPAPAVHHEEPAAEGQLPVDVYETAGEIVIRAFIAGVRPDEVNVSISRDQVVIEGSRENHTEAADAEYHYEELFWGSFSRTIHLPNEVDVDNSSAGAKDGLLTLILPKLDKSRQTKLRVKAG